MEAGSLLKNEQYFVLLHNGKLQQHLIHPLLPCLPIFKPKTSSSRKSVAYV